MNSSTASVSNCFQIQNSQVLAEFNDFQIAEMFQIKNQTSLESYFKGLSYTIEGGKDVFQCLKTDDYTQVRYFSSVYIASFLAEQARNCDNKKQLPILCKNIIEIAKKTFDDFLSRNQCSGNNSAIERTRFENYLSIVSSQDNQDTCLSGLYTEQKQCGMLYIFDVLGFFKEKDLYNHCTNINPEDSCCSYFIVKRTNAVLIFGASAGALLLFLLVVTFILCRRVPKWKDSNNSSDDDLEFESQKVSANLGNIKRVSSISEPNEFRQIISDEMKKSSEHVDATKPSQPFPNIHFDIPDSMVSPTTPTEYRNGRGMVRKFGKQDNKYGFVNSSGSATPRLTTKVITKK